MELMEHILWTGLATVNDVLPIIAILFGFQILVLRRRPPNPTRLALGFIYVLAGLTLFLVGLEKALFPLGQAMAQQLTAPEFIYGGQAVPADGPQWRDYFWVYVFGAAIGFATTVAEPSLIAVALKAEEVSAGAYRAWPLRLAVGVGVAVGVAVGAFRIVTGTPLPLYIMAGYVAVILLTLKAAKNIVPLAYDSGGVTTSTVTVPVVAALGLGLAAAVPGRSPLIDGFGLIAFASVFPIISVLGYALVVEYGFKARKAQREAATPASNRITAAKEESRP